MTTIFKSTSRVIRSIDKRNKNRNCVTTRLHSNFIPTRTAFYIRDPINGLYYVRILFCARSKSPVFRFHSSPAKQRSVLSYFGATFEVCFLEVGFRIGRIRSTVVLENNRLLAAGFSTINHPDYFQIVDSPDANTLPLTFIFYRWMMDLSSWYTCLLILIYTYFVTLEISKFCWGRRIFHRLF